MWFRKLPLAGLWMQVSLRGCAVRLNINRVDNMNHSLVFNQCAGSRLAHHHNMHSAICPAAIYHFHSLHYLCHNSICPPSTGTNYVDAFSMQLTLCTSGWNVKLIYLQPLLLFQARNLLTGGMTLFVLCGKIVPSPEYAYR